MRKQIVLSLWCFGWYEVVISAVTARRCWFGSTKSSVNSSYHYGKSCNRPLDARVVSCSSGVNSLMLSADSNAERARCIFLDVQFCSSLQDSASFLPATRRNTHFLCRVFPVIAPLVCLRGAWLKRTCSSLSRRLSLLRSHRSTHSLWWQSWSLDTLTVSNSPGVNSILLLIRKDAPEWTRYSFTSGSTVEVDVASQSIFGLQNVAPFSRYAPRMLCKSLAHFHTSLLAPTPVLGRWRFGISMVFNLWWMTPRVGPNCSRSLSNVSAISVYLRSRCALGDSGWIHARSQVQPSVLAILWYTAHFLMIACNGKSRSLRLLGQ